MESQVVLRRSEGYLTDPRILIQTAFHTVDSAAVITSTLAAHAHRGLLSKKDSIHTNGAEYLQGDLKEASHKVRCGYFLRYNSFVVRHCSEEFGVSVTISLQ